MSLKLYNGLIGNQIPLHTFSFIGADKEDVYKKNLQVMPDDWYYRSHNITYTYNKTGHRCIDINELDFDNYILFLGDSHTEGTGLEKEQTYAYLTAQRLNCSYYNLGLGGTGIDAMYHNLIFWISKFPKPKYINFYWSDSNRFLTKLGIADNKQVLGANGAWSTDSILTNFYKYGELSTFFETRLLLTYIGIESLLDSYKIPHSHISFIGPKLSSIKQFPTLDKARDLQHAGIETHKQVVDYLVSDFTDKYVNV